MAAPFHPLTLRFDAPYLEAAFRVDYTRRSHRLVRLSILLGLLQYAGYGLLDRWMVPVATADVRVVRWTVCAFMALGIAYTFTPWFRRTMQAALAAVPLVGGLGVAVMAWLVRADPAYHHYYAAIVLVLFYTHVLLRLRFVVAGAAGGVVVAAYLAVVAAAGMPGPVLANNAFFLVTASLCGMVASYALEHYARRVFAQARAQAQTNAALARALGGLRAAQDDLVRQEKLAGLGRLAAGVAHEIENPLNFITNFAGLSAELADEVADALADADLPGARRAEVAELLADLQANARRVVEHGARADAIVRRLGAATGAAPGPLQPVDLNALVRARAAAAPGAGAPGAVPVALDLDPAVPPVLAAPDELARALDALVANALDAVAARADAGGDGYAPAVALRTRRDGRGVRVEVADNGPGIPPALRPRLFEPFFTTKPTGTGTGLGLSLAYDVVTRRHGGSIAIASGAGGGTTVTVALPGDARAAA